MANHIHTGKAGEAMGIGWLVGKGYLIREQNWRHSHWEVDAIAEKNNVLHFIEIKTRRSQKFGPPEAKVDNRKIKNLIGAAEEYLHQYPQWQRIQFDVLSIILLPNQPADFFLIEDVYL